MPSCNDNTVNFSTIYFSFYRHQHACILPLIAETAEKVLESQDGQIAEVYFPKEGVEYPVKWQKYGRFHRYSHFIFHNH